MAANPTADATVTIPNETGTVVTTATTDAGLATSTISTKGFSIAMAVALG